jgi:hypothetical protein
MSVSDIELPYLNSADCYHYISKLTNNFRNIPIPSYRLKNKLIEVDKREYIPYIQKCILLSPRIYYGQLYIPSEISYKRRDIVAHIMGYKCYKLYLLSRKYNLIMIWYNNRTKEFVFYSNNENGIVRAMTYLFIEMDKYKL